MTKITEVQICPIKPRDGLVGLASFVYDEAFFLGSIGVHTRPNGGYRISYPTRKSGDSSFNTYHPIDGKLARQIEEYIAMKFEDLHIRQLTDV